MFFCKPKRDFRSLTLEEIKDKTRVLFIDDQDRKDIIDYLSKSGWKCRQLFEKDFDTFDSIDIRDSHIICVDINGVGGKLGKNNGLDIVKSIKAGYPNKKQIIYSSQSTQDIFHEAVDMADKKILKSAGDYEVFKNSIEDLAKTIFNWEEMVHSSYEMVKPYFGVAFTEEKYRKTIEKAGANKKLTEEQLSSMLKISVGLSTSIYQWIKLFI